MGMRAAILRSAYFIQNDLMIKEAIAGYGVYLMPVRDKGLTMIDVRDIAGFAAVQLLRRGQAPRAASGRPHQLVRP